MKILALIALLTPPGVCHHNVCETPTGKMVSMATLDGMTQWLQRGEVIAMCKTASNGQRACVDDDFLCYTTLHGSALCEKLPQ